MNKNIENTVNPIDIPSSQIKSSQIKRTISSNHMVNYISRSIQERANNIFFKDTIKKNKINGTSKDLSLINYNSYSILETYNFTIPQLKSLCMKYSLKKTGNKQQLYKRLYLFFATYSPCVKIQSLIRGYLVRSYIKCKGPGFKNRSICVNDTDFYTLDDLTEIPHNNFISIQDSDNYVYGFHIGSLYKYIYERSTNKTISKNVFENPYNRQNFRSDILKIIRKVIHKTQMIGYKVNIDIEDETTLTPEKELRLKTTELFQRFDEAGFYTDINWFLNLSRNKLIILYREIYDIWNYRSELSASEKCKICPTNQGNPFSGISYNIINSPNVKDIEVKEILLKIFNRMCSKNVSPSDRWRGVSFCLMGLTIVSSSAASALPYLYMSVMNN